MICTTTIDLGPAIQQIGIGALIAVPAYSAVWLLWKKLSSSQTEITKLQGLRVEDRNDQVTRERELADRLGPLLVQAVDILTKAPDQFDRALSQAHNATRASEVSSMMHQLEETVDRLRDRGAGK